MKIWGWGGAEHLPDHLRHFIFPTMHSPPPLYFHFFPMHQPHLISCTMNPLHFDSSCKIPYPHMVNLCPSEISSWYLYSYSSKNVVGVGETDQMVTICLCIKVPLACKSNPNFGPRFQGLQATNLQHISDPHMSQIPSFRLIFVP